MSTKATKPTISTATWPASRDAWHRYTALEIHAGVADIFTGKPRTDCLPRVPLRNEILPARYGGAPVFATGAAGNAEFATAMRKCFEDTTKFEEQERKAIAAGLTFCTPEARLIIEAHPGYAAAVATTQLDDMLTVFSEALTGSSASDKLGRLSFAFGITQATSPDYHSFMRALQEAYRKTKSDQRGDTVLIDDLFKAILMTKSSYDTFAPLITQLDAERAVPGQPQQRRLDQPFAMLVECFNKYYADITSRKKVAVAPTSSADRKHTKALDSAPKALLAQDESICVICSHLPARNGRSHAHTLKVPGQLAAYEQLLGDMKGAERTEAGGGMA